MALVSLARLRALVPRRRQQAVPPAPDPPAPPVLNREAELLVAPLPPDALGDGLGWWRTPYGRWRLEAEAEAMCRFPGFKVRLSDDGLLVWQGWLRSGLVPGSRYRVEVTYPSGFPDEAPEVAILKPRINPDATPHFLPSRRPCLYRQDMSRQGYEPARTTAATLVAWTALWIHAFETWRATGVWPGAEA